jgi:hypothetical protein
MYTSSSAKSRGLATKSTENTTKDLESNQVYVNAVTPETNTLSRFALWSDAISTAKGIRCHHSFEPGFAQTAIATFYFFRARAARTVDRKRKIPSGFSIPGLG